MMKNNAQKRIATAFQSSRYEDGVILLDVLSDNLHKNNVTESELRDYMYSKEKSAELRYYITKILEKLYQSASEDLSANE